MPIHASTVDTIDVFVFLMGNSLLLKPNLKKLVGAVSRGRVDVLTANTSKTVHHASISSTSVPTMPSSLTPNLTFRTTVLLRQLQRCAYSSPSSPPTVINVINIPAPHCGSIRILSFNRPAARNAISKQLLAELNHQVTSIHNEGEAGATRALILASEVDSSFCAGADLKERSGFTAEE